MDPLDFISEGKRILEAAGKAGIDLRMTGGVAIAAICPHAGRPPLRRPYVDIDFIGRSREVARIEDFFPDQGYQPEDSFNALHGEFRLFFHDEAGREADVFLDALRGCHTLDVKERLLKWPLTLPPADLLLSKLQVYETNNKDYLDIVALIVDHKITDDDEGISLTRIIDVCSADWGWWRTVTMVAERAIEFAEHLAADEPEFAPVPEGLRQIVDALKNCSKTLKWKMRARVGERLRWYELPEELAH